MIAQLRGALRSKAPERVIVDVGGVGYLVAVPLSTFYELPELGSEVELHVRTYVRAEAIELYGFRTAAEQALFEALIGVQGIGPKLAVTILSGMESDLLVASLVSQDVARLTTIPGVGKKTAERLALELKDKAAELVPSGAAVGAGHGVRGDVLSALVNLGYKPRVAEAALDRIEHPADEFETLLRQTLGMLAR